MNILTIMTSIAGVITLFVLLLKEFKRATPPISYHLHNDNQSITLFIEFGRLDSRPYKITKLACRGSQAPKIIGYKIDGIDTLVQNKKIKLNLTINPKFSNSIGVPIFKLRLEKTKAPFVIYIKYKNIAWPRSPILEIPINPANENMY
ncbi:hypothetical protein AB8Q18_04440 [Neisseriaceae bacterium CLB008]